MVLFFCFCFLGGGHMNLSGGFSSHKELKDYFSGGENVTMNFEPNTWEQLRVIEFPDL